MALLYIVTIGGQVYDYKSLDMWLDQFDICIVLKLRLSWAVCPDSAIFESSCLQFFLPTKAAQIISDFRVYFEKGLDLLKTTQTTYWKRF